MKPNLHQPNRRPRTLPPLAAPLVILLAATLALATPAHADDPFLEPQLLPPELRQLTMTDGTTGEEFVIRLDEDHLPMREDFFGEQAAIPFVIEGALVESGSGSRLPAWTVAPKTDGNGIDILMLHGNGGNILSNLGAGVALMKRGFRVTLLEYSGYGWATGEADRDNLLEDAAAGLTRFSAAARADGRPLVLYGMSLGGHLAVVTAANDPDAVDALVIEGAFTSHRDMASFRRGVMARVAVSEPYSAEQVIADFGKPLLVIHSRDDTIVPFSMGQELFELAGEPKELMEIEGPHLAGLATSGDEIGAAIEALVQAD